MLMFAAMAANAVNLQHSLRRAVQLEGEGLGGAIPAQVGSLDIDAARPRAVPSDHLG
jgi:hypothetical protein